MKTKMIIINILFNFFSSFIVKGYVHNINKCKLHYFTAKRNFFGGRILFCFFFDERKISKTVLKKKPANRDSMNLNEKCFPYRCRHCNKILRIRCNLHYKG